MAWDEERSRKRVTQHDASSFEVTVSDLVRDQDFENLTTTQVKRVQGAHIYADISNFHLAVDDAGGDQTRQKKLVRAINVLRKVQADLLRDDEVKPIQLQGARLHCLNFKPYNSDDEEETKKRVADRAKRSVIMGITLNSYLYDVYNSVFKDEIGRKLEGAAGIASGQSYVANIGFHGQRERISLGNCANLGAKVLDGYDTINITKDVYDVLPANLKGHFSKDRQVAGAEVYKAKSLRWSKQPELAKELGVDFDAEALKKKTEEYRDDLPLSDMEVIEASVLIDPAQLTERKSKRTHALAVFADIDGFTKLVQEAEDNDDVESLVRKLHMMRREFHQVVKKDYSELVIQHQGDRMVALVHTPTGDGNKAKRCGRGVDVAIGIQSSMDHVINERLGEAEKNLRVAVGVDVGRALVTRLGKHGRRLVIFLGPEVESAEDLQLRSTGQEIRISTAVYDNLEDEAIKSEFSGDGKGAYVAKGLTFPYLDDKEEEEAAKSNRMGVVEVGKGFGIVTSSDPSNRPVGASRPWADQ